MNLTATERSRLEEAIDRLLREHNGAVVFVDEHCLMLTENLVQRSAFAQAVADAVEEVTCKPS